jgi:hypothetical protein
MLAVLCLLFAVPACAAKAASSVSESTAQEVIPAKSHVRCAKPAPMTAARYAAMFAAVPTSQWGAADGSLSVPLPDGRVVWLYGDTFSDGRFAHSTAITQDQGCLHVSHGGAQILPDDDAKHVYWMDTASAVNAQTLLIRARTVTLVSTGAWDFRDGGHTRTAEAAISVDGDIAFTRWVSDSIEPAPDPGPMINCEAPASPSPHHLCYARHTHPWARLASGRTLVTTCQNWDASTGHAFADYRPIFTEASVNK